MIWVIAISLFALGTYLIISGIFIRLNEESKSGFWKNAIFIIFDLISGPMSSDGIRILFGGILIAVSILLIVI